MKICHLMTNFVRGGATNYIVQIMDNIKAEHYLVCGPGSDPKFLAELKRWGVKVKVNKFLVHKDPIKLFFCLFSLLFYFNKKKFDIIHTNSTEAGIVGRISGKCSGSTTVHTNHAVPFENRKFGFLLVFAEKVAALFSNKIIDISPKIKELFLEKSIGRNKHVVIPLGINVAKFRTARKLNISKELKVVTVSRLVKRKGLEETVKLADKLKDIQFVIVGSGPLEKKLSKSKKVKFLGYRRDVDRILKSCDVFMLLSETEGTPMVIYEAMAAGLPIVSTNVGGISDQVKENGFLVEDTKEAMRKIRILKSDETLRKNMGKISQKMVKDLTIRNMISRTRELYQALYLKQRSN